MTTLPGGCLCGRIRYSLNEAPLRVMQCHCRDCQRQSGSAFSVNAVVRRGRLAFEGDEPARYTGISDGGNTVHRHFCGRCGSPLFSAFDGVGVVALKLASLDDPTPYAPQASLWCDRMLPWVHAPEGVPTFARNPG